MAVRGRPPKEEKRTYRVINIHPIMSEEERKEAMMSALRKYSDYMRIIHPDKYLDMLEKQEIERRKNLCV